MTSPTPNARSSRLLPRRPHAAPPSHSIPANNTHNPNSPSPLPPATPNSAARASTGASNKSAHEHAIDFATHSWDLATGGLKTLTAKRELPARPDRRTIDTQPDDTSRGFLFAVIMLGCLVLILVGGGIVLFVMLQP